MNILHRMREPFTGLDAEKYKGSAIAFLILAVVLSGIAMFLHVRDSMATRGMVETSGIVTETNVLRDGVWLGSQIQFEFDGNHYTTYFNDFLLPLNRRVDLLVEDANPQNATVVVETFNMVAILLAVALVCAIGSPIWFLLYISARKKNLE